MLTEKDAWIIQWAFRIARKAISNTSDPTREKLGLYGAMHAVEGKLKVPVITMEQLSLF